MHGVSSSTRLDTTKIEISESSALSWNNKKRHAIPMRPRDRDWSACKIEGVEGVLLTTTIMLAGSSRPNKSL